MERLFNPDFLSLETLMFLKAASGGKLTEYEITGNPVAFNTNVTKALTGFTIPFLPIQSGTGDPSPENIRPITGWTGVNAYRTGVNIFDGEIENGRLNNSGENVQSNDNIRSKNYISVLPGKRYMVQFTRTAAGVANMRLYRYGRNNEYVGDSWVAGGAELAIPSNTYFLRFYMDNAYTAGTDREISFNYPSTDTEYHPYTGQSYPVTFPALGKNLFVSSMKNGNVDYSDGHIGIGQTYTNRIISDFVKLAPGTYTLSAKEAKQITIYFYSEPDETTYIASERLGNWTDLPRTFTITGTRYAIFVLRNSDNSNITPSDVTEIQLESGESATTYVPVDNTIYGGTIDPVTGMLTVTKAKLVKNTSTMDGGDGDNYPTWKDSGIKAIIGSGVNSQNISAVMNVGNKFGANTNGNYDNLIMPVNVYGKTQDQWKALAMDIEIVADLVTPIVYHLDPITVQTLIGDNTIWTDTNGENTIKYLKKG